MTNFAIGDVVRDLVGKTTADSVTQDELITIADNPALTSAEIDVVIRDVDLHPYTQQRKPTNGR